MKLIIAAVGIGVLVLLGYFILKNPAPEVVDVNVLEPDPVEQNEDDGWVISADEAAGVEFDHPQTFPAEYILPVDWPPKVQIVEEPYSCTEAGEETARAGKTAVHNVNGREYCVTLVSEGAAGSIYTQYAYAAERSGKHVILTFTTRSPQCANYDDPQKTECEEERASFNLDQLMDRVMQSIRFVSARAI